MCTLKPTRFGGVPEGWCHWERPPRTLIAALSLPLYFTSSHLFCTHTLASSLCMSSHTHRQMSSTLKLNGWPDGESLSFSNKDLSLLSLHPSLPSSAFFFFLRLFLSLFGQYVCVIVIAWKAKHNCVHRLTHKHMYSTCTSTVTHAYMHETHTHTPYGCIITESEAALRNNYRGWLLLLLLIPTNKPVHKQDGGVRSRSSHFCDTAPSPSYPCVLVSFWFVFIWTNESTQTPKCCTQDLYLYRAKSQQKLPQSPLYCKLKAIW